jgi:hypothetical protein
MKQRLGKTTTVENKLPPTRSAALPAEECQDADPDDAQ